MDSGLEHRLTVIEQKLGVMMTEVNECLAEVETAMLGMAKGSKMALEVLQMQIGKLRTEMDAILAASARAEAAAPRPADDPGKEL